MSKQWGRLTTVVAVKEELTVKEAIEYLSSVGDEDAIINITVSTEDDSWSKMLRLNKVSKVSYSSDNRSYVLDFKNKKYSYKTENGSADMYLTDSEARAVYFCLVQDVYLPGFSDTMANIRRRLDGLMFRELSFPKMVKDFKTEE